MAAECHFSSPIPRSEEQLQNSRTIEVRKFNPNTSDETFETFFENKRRTGGGEIEKIDADDRAKGIIRVTFVEAGVADNVLSRSDLCLDNALLELSPLPTPPVWDRKTIEVHGLHSSTSCDAIELFFESKRRSGGDAVEHMHLHPDCHIATVTFEAPGVAERVLQMPALVLEGAKLTVRPKEQTSLDHSTPSDTVHETYGDIATGEETQRLSVSSGISVESFEEEELDIHGSYRSLISAGESIGHVHTLPRESGKKVVSRNGSVGTAASVTVTETEEQDPCDREEDVFTIRGSREDDTVLVPTPNDEQKPVESASDVAQSSVRILRIDGFTPAMDKETVEMFIENQSGEMELDSCDFDVEAGVAVVAFKNPQGAEKLMRVKRLTLGGAQLSVTPLCDVYAGLDVEASRPRAVRVCGIASDTSREFLTLLFENRRISGGGEIEELEYDNNTGTAIFTFTDPDSARRVADNQTLKVSKSEVEVTLMTPERALPVVLGPVTQTLVLVSSLPGECTADHLREFFSKSSCNSEIRHITFSQRPGVAMLDFTGPPDFDSLRVLCVSRPLHGSMLSVRRVPVSRTLHVHNIGHVSEDMLALYFESRKHSAGGRVNGVSVYREHGYALVEMEDPSLVDDILARGSHTLEDQPLHVTVYYEDLGPIHPSQDAPTTSTKPVSEKITVSGFNPDILSFVHTSAICRQIVGDKMTDVAADICWGNYTALEDSVELTCITDQWEKITHSFDKEWKQVAEDTLLEVLNAKFASDEVLVPQEIWTGFLERIGYVKRLDSNRIAVEVKDDESRVSVVGQIEEVQNILRRLKGDRAKLQPGLLPTPQTTGESVRNLKEHQLRMLGATGFKGKMQKRFRDLTVVIDHKARSVCFTGLPGSIATAKADMSECFNNLMSTQLEMSAALIKVITGTVVTKYVVQGFKAKNIRAVFHAVGNGKLGIWAFSKENLTVAVKVIESCVDMKKIRADMTAVQSTERWQMLLDRVRAAHEGLVEITKAEDGVIVSGAVKPVELAINQLHDFLLKMIVVEKSVSMKHGTANYMAKYMKKEINDVQITFQEDKVKVIPRVKPWGFTVKGSKAGIDGAMRQIQAMARNVKVERCKVDTPGASEYLASGEGKQALASLQTNHKVVIEPVTTSHQDVTTSRQDATTSRREGAPHTTQDARDSSVLSSITLPGGVTVEVIQGNLIKFHADVIVNTANEQLDHVGGLAKAIVTAGGPAIQKQCHAYVKDHGKLQPGQVQHSTSGRLPCKALLHAVGPVWQGGELNEEAVLRVAITNCLIKTEQLGMSSIAIPPLSSGAFGFPIDTCTTAIMSAVRDFLDTHKDTCVKKVTLIDRTDTIVKSFGKSLDVTFGSQEKVASGGATAADDTIRSTAGSPVPLLTTPVNPEMPGASSRSTDIVLETQEGITLTLCKAEMARMKVDAIVNSTDCGLRLDGGALSHALLQHAGQTLQVECHLAAPDGIEYGEVVTTSGGQLSCQLVIHGACCHWDGGAGQSEQVLRAFVANSLLAAHAHHLTSIALPAIGTGTLGFPPEVVAQVMLDELQKFSRNRPETQVRDVRFVVYEKNVPTTQAFEKTLRSCGLRPVVSPGVRQRARGRVDEATASSASAKSKPRHRSRSRRCSLSYTLVTASQTQQPQQQPQQQQQQQPISCMFNIFAQSPAVIARAVKALKQMCDKECTEIVLNSKAVQSTIAKLTSGQVSQIKLLQRKLDVKIDIRKTPPQRIVIHGTAANTNKARAEILEIFIHVVETEGKERVASVISKQFQWKYGEGAVLRNYPPTINSQLELAYQDKKDGFKWKEEGTGDVFVVLFDKMIERSNRSSSSVKVERCVIGDDNDLPANWSTVADTEHVKLEVLKPSSSEYQDVETKFVMSAQGGVTKVIKIERVQNPGLYRQYMLRKEEMKKRLRPPAVIERSLWHGTSHDAVQNINMGGFNRSYCGKNATAYGNGVYFAVDSEYSTRYTYSTPDMIGQKRVYKSLVLTGDFTTGRSSYRVPPDNPDVPGLKYDTVVDNVNSPGIFVVFLDNQAYPEYLITFV